MDDECLLEHGAYRHRADKQGDKQGDKGTPTNKAIEQRFAMFQLLLQHGGSVCDIDGCVTHMMYTACCHNGKGGGAKLAKSCPRPRIP